MLGASCKGLGFTCLNKNVIRNKRKNKIRVHTSRGGGMGVLE